jgi:hypothetical protein
VTMTDSARTAAAPATPNGAAAPVTLPAGPEMHRWIERTRQERQALVDRAARLRERFEPIRRELAGIERSIKVLDHFLAQVTVEDGPEPTAKSGRRGVSLLNGQWSREHAACLGCGTTERKHIGNGYCSLCYHRRRHGDAS